MRATPRESGQTLVLTTVMLVVLLTFAALVMEGGNAFLQRRQMQGVADSAALAGAQLVGTSRSNATIVARDYVTNQNAAAKGEVLAATAIGAGSSTCGSKHMPAYSVCVRTKRVQMPLFGAFLKGSTVGASAVAAMSEVKNMKGWLPFGVMENQYVSGQQVDFRPGSVAPAGSINTPAGTDCKFYGGNNVRDVIKSQKWGGADACAIDVGQKIETQTGVTSGVINQGFADRLTTNTDRFEDVFELDPATGKYSIKLPNSPRLGIVPLAGGAGMWPLTAGQQMMVSGYVFVYIGDRTRTGYPAITGNGSGLTIHLTPVNAILPDDWDANFMEYRPGSNNITAIRLVG